MKQIRNILCLVAIIGLLSACQKDEPSSISLSSHVLELTENTTYQLTLSVQPSDAKADVVWSSSDSEIAIVSETGLVTALQVGQVTITATVGTLSSECVVLVSAMDLAQNVRMGKSAKRGVSYSFSIDGDVDLLAPYISWSYNWGPAPSNTTIQADFDRCGLDFCPMAWNGSYDADKIRAYKQTHPNCQYLLAFNEPNLTDQCNYTPAQAAAQWPALKALAAELNMKIVSPAMNYGTLSGYGDPIVWLDEFFAQDGVSINDIAAISIHCYMGKASSMKSYVDRFRKYGKPIWMTEFCAWETFIGSVKSQMEYMSEAINFLETDADVERYAWFIPRASGSVESYPYMQLLTKTAPYALSELGQVFAGLSSFDKSVWHPSDSRVLAQEYSDLCTSDGMAGPHLRPSTDVGGQLDMYDFGSTQWAEYQIENAAATTQLQVRCNVWAQADCQISVDGTEVATINATGTANAWKTNTYNVPISAGKHTIRFYVSSGSMDVHWFNFK